MSLPSQRGCSRMSTQISVDFLYISTVCLVHFSTVSGVVQEQFAHTGIVFFSRSGLTKTGSNILLQIWDWMDKIHYHQYSFQQLLPCFEC